MGVSELSQDQLVNSDWINWDGAVLRLDRVSGG